MVSLATLRDSGKAREVPIFGFIHDIMVLGVMDEIEKRPLPAAEEEESPSKESGKISFYFKSMSPTKRTKTALYLVDSKTRRTPALPKEDFTVAASFVCQKSNTLSDK
jgi:exonuclease V